MNNLHSNIMKLLKNFSAIAVALVLLASAAVGCTSDKKDTSSGKIDVLQFCEDSSVIDRLKKIRENTVRITNQVGNYKVVGTGFFLPSGYLLTNSHIVDIKGDISVEYFDGEKQSAEIFANSLMADLALLKVNNPHVQALQVEGNPNIDTSEDVYAIGYGLDLLGDATVTKGILSAKRSAHNIDYMQTDAAINGGFSGGPMLDEAGHVIGLISLAAENASTAFAVAGNSLNRIVEELIETPSVHYVENERPQNAISSMLVEVGLIVSDPYNESIMLEELSAEESGKSDEPNTSDIIEGDHKTQNAEPAPEYEIQIPEVPSAPEPETPTPDPLPETSEPLPEPETPVAVDPPAPPPATRLEGINKIVPWDWAVYSNAAGENVFQCYWRFEDSDGVSLQPETYPSSIVKSITIDVRSGWSYQEDDNAVDDDDHKPIRLLKSFYFGEYSTDPEFVEIPISEIRALMTDEDYERSPVWGSDLTLYMYLETREQGTFRAKWPEHLEKPGA